MEELIEINPKIMVGKPVIKGTRISVEIVLEKLASGESIDDILRSYPHPSGANRYSLVSNLPIDH